MVVLKTAILASVAVTALALSTPAFACGCTGGGDDPKGNNGWGNGADTTNSGSFSGGTAPTKSTNGNPNQTDKFTGR
jgi:hypothetical protein